MENLTEKQQKRLLKLAEFLDEGTLALLKHVVELEDRIDESTGELIGPQGEKGERGEKGDKGDKGDKGEKGDQGERGEDGKDGRDGVDGKNGVDGKDGENGSSDTPEQIAEKLQSLEGDKRLDKKAIKGIEEIEKDIASIPRGRTIGGGSRGIQLYTNGTKRGLVQSINIIPGIGVSLSYSQANGRNDITINASASTSVLTATGTIDDSNTAFIFTSEPAILVINGASYQQTGGAITWTWTAGTLTATLSSAIGSGGSIFGLA